MTFEEANDRYLDILKQISYIENPAEKDNMYNLAHQAIGTSLGKLSGPSWSLYSSTVKPETEEEIKSFEKMLSIEEDQK